MCAGNYSLITSALILALASDQRQDEASATQPARVGVAACLPSGEDLLLHSLLFVLGLLYFVGVDRESAERRSNLDKAFCGAEVREGRLIALVLDARIASARNEKEDNL